MLALLGGLFHTMNHALFQKPVVLDRRGSCGRNRDKKYRRNGRLIKTMPYHRSSLFNRSVQFPHCRRLNGFASELMIFQAFLQSFIMTSPFLKILMFAGLSLFAFDQCTAAACFVKAFGIIFLASPRSTEPAKPRGLPLYDSRSHDFGHRLWVLGVFSYQILAAFGQHLPIPNLMIIGLLLIICF